MKKTARIILTLMALAFAHPPAVCLAQTFNAQLLANQSALDGEFNAMFDMSESILTTGVNGVYKDDQYRYLNAKLSIGNELITPGLTGDLGIFGNIGRFEKTDRKAYLTSAGFMLTAAYDLSREVLDEIPVIFLTRISMAPEPLCFQDTDRFAEIVAEVQWQALRQAAVILRYRYLDVDFQKKGDEWQKTDSEGYVGLKFNF
jgi:hypothetical protein